MSLPAQRQLGKAGKQSFQKNSNCYSETTFFQQLPKRQPKKCFITVIKTKSNTNEDDQSA